MTINTCDHTSHRQGKVSTSELRGQHAMTCTKWCI